MFHRQVGGLSGAGLAAYRAHKRPGADVVAELIGGYVGGRLGGSLPDIIDPPTSPRHRSIGHGVVPISYATKWVSGHLNNIQEACRIKAAELDQRAANMAEGLERTLCVLAAFFLRFLSGAAAGVIAGYLSHLSFDFFTPASLPLFC